MKLLHTNLAGHNTPGIIITVLACGPWHSKVVAGEVEVVEEAFEHVLGLRSQQVCISLAWSSCCPFVQLLC